MEEYHLHNLFRTPDTKICEEPWMPAPYVRQMMKGSILKTGYKLNECNSVDYIIYRERERHHSTVDKRFACWVGGYMFESMSRQGY